MKTLFVITKKMVIDSDNDSNHGFFFFENGTKLASVKTADRRENIQNTKFFLSS
jgi:hypothetical protein